MMNHTAIIIVTFNPSSEDCSTSEICLLPVKATLLTTPLPLFYSKKR